MKKIILKKNNNILIIFLTRFGKTIELGQKNSYYKLITQSS
jgi:hypothetical protein